MRTITLLQNTHCDRILTITEWAKESQEAYGADGGASTRFFQNFNRPGIIVSIVIHYNNAVKNRDNNYDQGETVSLKELRPSPDFNTLKKSDAPEKWFSRSCKTSISESWIEITTMPTQNGREKNQALGKWKI